MDVECSLQQDNNSCTIIFSMFDVTKYILRQEKLNRVLQIFEKSDDIIYSFDLKPEPNYIYLSPAIEKCLGYSLDENKKNPFLACDVVHPDYYDVQVSKIRGEIDIDSNQSFITRYKHKTSGEYIWFEDQCIPIYDEYGELRRIDGICRNIHERKQLEEKLWYLSYHDTLTGLYNRTYFEERIKELDEGRDVQAGIVICDLDNLKYINDKLGHYEGDQIIK
ncbi:sensor domain-containing diguanylate cyclase [Alkaliphilus peptidifermentans]|uniref:PAS domain S-box-containing protein/diguanylate cyclase (GGDEF) domain-containing protein n=1 Tax=Alkaliphilus peptidifermentans DSM 18978 TaxID=1120976 RepID=A0A1G5KRY7_9FIRM|nr:PAS domain S-box protein [Alkaliphilus peptidifermentans]SCZ02941.1 PAS domain S-box-containing protein/diguanylate cyclase (GGDEF) domain-containing protein [Alkaliphilus peptidifermentans DSM 18978]